MDLGVASIEVALETMGGYGGYQLTQRGGVDGE